MVVIVDPSTSDAGSLSHPEHALNARHKTMADVTYDNIDDTQVRPKFQS